MGSLLGRARAPPLLAQQVVHVDRRRVRARRRAVPAGRPRRRPPAAPRSGRRRPGGRAADRPPSPVDVDRSSGGHPRPRLAARPERPGRRLPAHPAGGAGRVPARLQQPDHVRAGHDRRGAHRTAVCWPTSVRGCSTRSASVRRGGTPTSTVWRSGSPASICRPSPSRGSGSCCCRTASGTGSASCRRAGWRLATRKHIDNDDDPNGPVDWRQGYGYQYWMARHGFRGDGAHGQFCVVVPEADLVVATTARVDDMQQVLDVLWDRLLPALDADAGGADRYASEARLTERLESLALPVVVPTHEGPDGHGPVRRRRDGRGPAARPRRPALRDPRRCRPSTRPRPSAPWSCPSPAGPTTGPRVSSVPAGSRAASEERHRSNPRRSSVAAAGRARTPSRPTSCSSRHPTGSVCGATVPGSRRRWNAAAPERRLRSRLTYRADLGARQNRRFASSCGGESCGVGGRMPGTVRIPVRRRCCDRRPGCPRRRA